MSAATARPAPSFPRLQLGIVAAVLGGVLLASAAARFTGYANSPAMPVPIATVSLFFTDMPDGSVAITNAATGHVVSTVPVRGGGFLRSTMRVLTTERARESIGPAQPFTLRAFPGSRYQLIDPATGETLELEAFGSQNVAEFAAILNATEAHP